MTAELDASGVRPDEAKPLVVGIGAAQPRTSAEAIAGPVRIDGDEERVKVIASPVFDEQDTSRGMILLLFDSMGGAGAPRALRYPRAA